MASLTIDSGSLSGTRRDVVRDVLVLGRDRGCDIVFGEDTISRKHARLVRSADGCYLEDLHSRNGTFLNGARVHGPVRLRDGDSIQLYEVVITFSDGTPAATKPTESGFWLQSPELTSIAHKAYRHNETLAEIDISSPEGSWVTDRADVRLQAVLDVSRQLRSWLGLPELYERILDCLVRIFPQLRLACVLRIDEDGGRLVIDASRSPGTTDPHTAGPIMQSIVRKAFADEKALLMVDVAHDVTGAGSIHEDDHRCVMCAPLLDSLRSPLGALYLDSSDVQHPFGFADLDVLACVALLTSQAVEQATLHNARYRAAVNLSTDAILTFDAQGRMESFNPAAIDLFGYDPADMRHVSIRDLTPALAPLIDSADEDQAAAALWTFRRSTETSGRRADGSSFPVRLSVGEVKLGEHRLFTASVHDITDVKKVEQSLKQSRDELELAVEERTGYVLLQQEIATISNEADTVERAFQSAFDEIRKTTRWPIAHVYVRSETEESEYVDAGIWSASLVDDVAALQAATQDLELNEKGDGGRTAVGRVIASRHACRAVGQAALVGDPRADLLESLGLLNVLAFPVFVGDDVAAVMEFFAPTDDVPDDGLMTVMAHVGMQLGRVMERRRLQKELVDAVWDQQRDFGLELHDTIGQELAGIGMLADSLARKLTERQAPETRQCRELADMLQHAKQGVRRLAKGLLPVEVDADGLKSALEELAETTEKRSGIPVDVWCDERLQLTDNSVATHLFRIAQEAVTNALRHAEAQHLALKFARTEAGDVELSVSDDGTGMRQGKPKTGRGVGLQIMKYRAQVINADFDIQSGAEGGTVVACRLSRSNHHVSENGRRARQRVHRR